MKYIGVDFHKQYFVATVMGEDGKVMSKDRVSTDRAAIRGYFRAIAAGGEDIKVVIEACYGWSYFYDQVRDMVSELKVAHPLKTRAIAEARIKTDSIDSEVLGHLLRAELVAEAYAPDFETRDKKNLMRYRSSLVRTRTMLKNRVHAVLTRNHIEEVEFRSLSDKFGKKGRRYMRGFKLMGNDTEILNGYLDLIEGMDEEIRCVENRIRKAFRRDEICKLIESVPGVGEILAVLIRYEIDKIERFRSAKKLCSYAGLVPSTYSSGGRTYQGKITKQGNRWLRWAMVEAAQRATGGDLWLSSYYQRITRKRGTKKARVALARKLLEIIYRIWKDRRPYYGKEAQVAVAL